MMQINIIIQQGQHFRGFESNVFMQVAQWLHTS